MQEIQNTGNPVLKVKRGKGGGTYVVEQLVYHYASWISPEMAWGYAAVNIIHQF
ncbi:KilA-N domain-containing protein [Salmonella enterica subsp. enterica]|nr:KilA-N domain-containing protein [Salmonella enterica subsp. enterica serovar Hessarek]